MYSAYSFVNIPSMIDNAVGKVAPLGELSKASASFSKEHGFYSDAVAAPYVRLVCLRSTEADDSTNNVTLVPMATGYSDPLLQVANWFAKTAINSGFTNDSALAAQNFSTEFPTFTLLDIGKMYTNTAGQWLPGSVAMKLNGASEDNYLKLWFVDAAFQAEYSFYTIEVLPPLPNVDDLTKDYETTIPALQALTIEGQIKKAKDLWYGGDYTLLDAEAYAWYDFEDPTKTTPATFVLAIWGAAGNNDDAKRQAIRDYVLANSQYGADRWEVHLPDAFIPTEFYLIPLWDRIAVPEQTVSYGVYRPAVKPNEAVSISQDTMDGYTAAWVTGDNVEVVSTTMKSVLVLALGNEKNRLAKSTFSAQWPGYAAIPTTHIDFDNMSPTTQQFVYLLNAMLVTAETLNEFSDLPAGMSRVTRGNKLYLASTLNDCQYLMLAKQYFTDKAAAAKTS